MFAARAADDEAVAGLLDGRDMLAALDAQPDLALDAAPQLQQLLLAGRTQSDVADDRQAGRLGHDDLAARILEHAAAERFLLERHELHAALERRERSRKTGGARADDHQVQDRAAARAARMDLLHRLPALLDGIADQSHAAQFARDEHAGDIRLEPRRHARQVHAARRRAEDEFDRADGASRAAGAVADALGGAHEARLAADQAEYVVLRLFRAGADAGAAADALQRIHDRMQRSRFQEAGAHRLLVRAQAPVVQPAPAPGIDAERQQDRDEVDGNFHRILRTKKRRQRAGPGSARSRHLVPTRVKFGPADSCDRSHNRERPTRKTQMAARISRIASPPGDTARRVHWQAATDTGTCLRGM